MANDLLAADSGFKRDVALKDAQDRQLLKEEQWKTGLKMS